MPVPHKLDYMTTAERLTNKGILLGIKEGRREGIKSGIERGQLAALRSAVIDVLKARFGRVPKGLVDAVASMNDLKLLRKLLRSASACENIEGFAQTL